MTNVKIKIITICYMAIFPFLATVFLGFVFKYKKVLFTAFLTGVASTTIWHSGIIIQSHSDPFIGLSVFIIFGWSFVLSYMVSKNMPSANILK